MQSLTTTCGWLLCSLLVVTEKKICGKWGNLVFMLLIRVVEYETKPIPDRQPFVPLLRTGDGGRKEASWILDHNGSTESSQVKLSLPKFHRNRTRKYYNTALFLGGCWVSLTGRFHRHSAAGWAECAVAGPGRVRRHAAQFSERSSTPLIGHARVALSGVLTRLPSTQTDDAQRGGKGHKLLPAPLNAMAHRKVSKARRK